MGRCLAKGFTPACPFWRSVLLLSFCALHITAVYFTAVWAGDVSNPQSETSSQAQRIKSLRVHDLDGRQHLLFGSSDRRGVALVFLSTEDVQSQLVIPRLSKLANSYQKQGVELWGVISARSTTRQQAKEFSRKQRIKFPLIFDSAASLRELVGATHAPQAFVFNHAGQEIYQGLIDDTSERPGKKGPARKQYLSDAMHAVAKNQRLPITETQADGDLLPMRDADETMPTITFNRDIAPIVYSNCVPCHREGEVAPFPLTNYEHVSKRAAQIVAVITEQIMPPWKPAADYGHFTGERRLCGTQVQLITRWVESDCPEGEAEDLTPLPKFPTGWQLGKPDLIVRMPRRFALAAEGVDIYQHFVIPMGMNQDRLIKAVEVHPGNAKIVHHAHMFVDNTGQARILDEADPAEGYTRFGGHGLSSAAYLGGWNPGATPHFFPKGTGRLIPKGGDAVFQIHYHPSGKPEFDQTEIGIYYAAPDAQQLIADLVVGNVDLVIPAGAAEARFTAEYTSPVNLLLMEIRPHMHLLGKSYQVRGVLPSGTVVPLIKIEDWDFNWQDSYVFDPVVSLPAGSQIQVEVVYDNSSKNPANPHSPPKIVYFGEESTDEMSNCAIRVTTETYAEFQQVVADNGQYWSTQLQKYLDRNMTPDKKPRHPRTSKTSAN